MCEDIDNTKRYRQLTGELARIIIKHTLLMHAVKNDSGESADVKKSKPKRVRNSFTEPDALIAKEAVHRFRCH